MNSFSYVQGCSEIRTSDPSDIGIRARGAAAPPRFGYSHYFSGKSKIFRAEAYSQKMKKILLVLLNEKTELIPASEIKCPKSGIFTNNYWVG